MSINERTKISSREKNYFTMIPNIVTDMFISGIINKNTFSFYVICKRVAGDGGVCYKSRRTLMKQMKCSTREIQIAKEELSKPRDFLNGKSLIILEKQEPGSQDADHIMIEDIWLENMTIYHDKTARQKFPTLFPGEPPPVPIGTTPRFPGEPKEEPKTNKKNPYIERTNVHKSIDAEKSMAETCEQSRSVPFNKKEGDQFSFPSEKPGQHIDDFYEEQLEWLKSQKDTSGLPISEKQLMVWVRKYELAEIAEALLYSYKFHAKNNKNNKGLKNFYAFVQTRLDSYKKQKGENIKINKDYLKTMNENGHLTGIISCENYCYYQNNKYKEFYFHLPPEEFKKQLTSYK
jgi:hypothetical protein